MNAKSKKDKTNEDDQRDIRNKLSWVKSKRSYTEPIGEDKPRGKQLQQRGKQLRNERGAPGWTNAGRSNKEAKRSSTNRTRTNIEQASKGMEEEDGCRIDYKFTLQEIRDSLHDDILENLLSGNFTQTQIVVISKKPERSKFLEDLIMRRKKPGKQRKKSPPKKPKLPSEIFENELKSSDEFDITVEKILGTYFVLYKKIYKDEDPEWNSKNIQKAKIIVNKLLEETGTNKLEVMTYVKRIMPLWYRRLVSEEKFPDQRPSLSLLFNGKRWFWNNRKILYRQWL